MIAKFLLSSIFLFVSPAYAQSNECESIKYSAIVQFQRLESIVKQYGIISDQYDKANARSNAYAAELTEKCGLDETATLFQNTSYINLMNTFIENMNEDFIEDGLKN